MLATSAKGTQDSAHGPNIGERYATLHGLYKNHPAPRGSSVPGSEEVNSRRCAVAKTLLPSTGCPRGHCNRGHPIAHNVSPLRPRCPDFIFRSRASTPVCGLTILALGASHPRQSVARSEAATPSHSGSQAMTAAASTQLSPTTRMPTLGSGRSTTRRAARFRPSHG
jgi:hypothetical protein